MVHVPLKGRPEQCIRQLADDLRSKLSLRIMLSRRCIEEQHVFAMGNIVRLARAAVEGVSR